MPQNVKPLIKDGNGNIPIINFYSPTTKNIKVNHYNYFYNFRRVVLFLVDEDQRRCDFLT